jgi:hypothetical protein
MKTRLLWGVVVTVSALGCSAPADPAPTTAAAMTESGSSGGNSTAGAGESSEPTAPTIADVMKMDGSLHVTWKNVDTSCDSVQGERQAKMADGSIMESYKVVFTVPAEADNKHDTSASDDMEYTYRLRCKKGSTYSAYSNEVSKNPKR